MESAAWAFAGFVIGFALAWFMAATRAQTECARRIGEVEQRAGRAEANAADADHRLIEDGMKKRVVLATPTTLITLPHAVAYGWKQEHLAANAQAINDLVKQLYERMRTLAGYITDIGNGLDKATLA
ncbi:MAG: DNA recombination protein RmuC [Nitrospira sp.]|nr:DNA recombination protein RmuC [Nitrospira sp.]